MARVWTPGLDLLALMHASEWPLAGVCVLLLPIPPTQKVIAAGYKDLFDASEAVAQVFEAGLMPAALEVVDGNLIKR